MKILFFTAPGCAPCAQMKPEMFALQGIHDFQLEVISASQETQATFVAFGIRSAPTLVAIDSLGIEIDRLVGAADRGRLLGFLVRVGAMG